MLRVFEADDEPALEQAVSDSGIRTAAVAAAAASRNGLLIFGRALVLTTVPRSGEASLRNASEPPIGALVRAPMTRIRRVFMVVLLVID